MTPFSVHVVRGIAEGEPQTFEVSNRQYKIGKKKKTGNISSVVNVLFTHWPYTLNVVITFHQLSLMKTTVIILMSKYFILT